MKIEHFSFTDPYGQLIQCFKWSDSRQCDAAIQIVHGMAEHASRYDNFAEFLVNSGFVVYANDHRGHGLTAGIYENTGYFADKNGWEIVTDNVYQLSEIIKKDNPDIPLFLFGHSMGSLIARNYISKYTDAIKGVILSGTLYNPAYMLIFGNMIANIQKLFHRRNHRSKLLGVLSFGNFNKKFKPARTVFDWISSDKHTVDIYKKDMFCGFHCSASLYSDIFSGILHIQKDKVIKKTPFDMSLMLISGESDPVGNFGKGVKKVHKLYKDNGVQDIEIILYKDGRHEMINEINKEQVYSDILSWIKKRIKNILFQ
jgi:alpha-beta hydrolase superfamily lysophospholipase